MLIIPLTILSVAFAALGLLVFSVRLCDRRQFSIKDLLYLTAALTLPALAIGVGNRRLAAIPRPVSRSFVSWNAPWTTKAMAAGEYEILLDYARTERGRLLKPLRFTLFDLTSETPVATDSWHVGGSYVGGRREGVIVGVFRALEGHRYTIEVDADQVEALARYRSDATLVIVLSGRESNNRIGRALGLSEASPDTSNSGGEAARPRASDPTELEKARNTRKAQEAEKQPRQQSSQAPF